MVTRSPFRKRDLFPVSTTTPANSCPGVQGDSSDFRYNECRSVPQSALALICITTPSSCGTGSETCSIVALRLPKNFRRFISGSRLLRKSAQLNASARSVVEDLLQKTRAVPGQGILTGSERPPERNRASNFCDLRGECLDHNRSLVVDFAKR